jgi:phosphatidate cytidylyltransferase
MSNLTQRLLTAIVALPFVIYLLILGGIPFTLLVATAALVGLYEFYAMMEARGFKPMKTTGYVLGVAFVMVAHFGDEYFLAITVTFSALIPMVIQLMKRDVRTSIIGMSVTIFGMLYVAWLLAHAILVRNLGVELVERYGGQLIGLRGMVDAAVQQEAAFTIGVFYIFLVFACTFLNDTGAYFAGRFFGKHKLAPIVSPKKTWEGAVGGVIWAVAGACIITFIFNTWIPGGHFLQLSYGAAALLGFVIGVVGDIGDLVESLIKRDADIKDSGWIIPGHGGILDRADALLFTFPVTYYFAKTYYFIILG